MNLPGFEVQRLRIENVLTEFFARLGFGEDGAAECAGTKISSISRSCGSQVGLDVYVIVARLRAGGYRPIG